jgi:aminopeptidase-like protein
LSLEDLQEVAGSRLAGERVLSFVRDLLPICRSITGEGVRSTLQLIGARIPLVVHEVPSGTPVFDWQVPQEWNIRDAYVQDKDGRRVVDFRESNLHVVSYSVPVHRTMSLAELRPHLHTLPERPDWIPYRTSYYQPNWGFCLRDRDLQGLSEGLYEVHIDSTLAPGSLTYAECLIPGASNEEVLVFTHVCHPSLANDNTSGLAVATELARAMLGGSHRFSYRFVFAPGTIGSITWLARNEAVVPRIVHGLVLGLLGDPGPLTYKRSVRGDAEIDRAAAYVLNASELPSSIEDYSPYGYDERQFCSPGFDLPVGRLTRSANDRYPEYHTSADDLGLLSGEQLGGSIACAAQLLALLEANVTYRSLNPKCEPQLGRRGLYRQTGGNSPAHFEHALLWVMNQSNGNRCLLDIAERSGIAFGVIQSAARALAGVGLLEESMRSRIVQ